MKVFILILLSLSASTVYAEDHFSLVRVNEPKFHLYVGSGYQDNHSGSSWGVPFQLAYVTENQEWQFDGGSDVRALADSDSAGAWGTRDFTLGVTRIFFDEPSFYFSTRVGWIEPLSQGSSLTPSGSQQFVQFRGQYGQAVRKAELSLILSRTDATAVSSSTLDKTLRVGFRTEASGTQLGLDISGTDVEDAEDQVSVSAGLRKHCSKVNLFAFAEYFIKGKEYETYYEVGIEWPFGARQ